jgi:hypothetical protein
MQEMLLLEGDDTGLQRAGCGESRTPGSGGGVGKHSLAVRPAPTSHLPHLRRELRDAVKRVRRKPRLIISFFQGAQL